MKILFYTLSILIVALGISPFVVGQQNTEKNMPKATQIVPLKANGFFAGEVKLLKGPFKESQDAESKVLLSLDVDRLLAPFIISSGIEPKQPMYLGWETKVLPGVALSFYLSGISRMYMSTGNKEFLKRLNYILDELHACQIRNDGYLLGTLGGKNIFARVEKEGYFPGFGFWGRGEATPYYSLEKLLSGLRDVYRITNNAKALDIAVEIGNWLAKHMTQISSTNLQRLMLVEYGGMNWVLADLYADTNDKRFLELSNRWHDTVAVVPTSMRMDVLNHKHANMQFPKMSGLAARYPYSGNADDLVGSTFFWETVVNHRSYVTGGNSESEFFGPPDSLSNRLTPFTAENCNEYNMLRLTKLLFEIEPKVEYADYIERTLFNHILAAQDPSNGQLSYFLPLMPGAKRVYQPLELFSCCTASGLDSYTRHGEYIYSHNKSTIYVNLFIASELTDREKGVVLSQQTDFPDTDLSTLTIKCSTGVKMDLAIRNPFWANNGVIILVNEEKQKITASRDGYFHINRNWNNNDKIKVKLPMRLRTEAMHDNKNMIALFYGPILLAADLNVKQATELVRDGVAPALITGNLPVNKWLVPNGNEPLSFTTTVMKPEQVRLIPLYRKKQGEFAVYWNTLDQDGWKERTAAKQQKMDDAKKLDLITLDQVNVKDSIAELNHRIFGTSITGYGNDGILKDQKWRKSATSAFGYELKVSDLYENRLFVQYMGRGVYESWNCHITIDGKIIESLKRGKDDSYSVNLWQDFYQIPIELTKGKQTVKVSFVPVIENKMQMPGIVEIRILSK
ncbi:MAG: glycoside hydrolase family 127 protein [Ferruginibacter sp.]|nr:glycoside hydrolase family 127 protein [Ferruginibacter sp.]